MFCLTFFFGPFAPFDLFVLFVLAVFVLLLVQKSFRARFSRQIYPPHIDPPTYPLSAMPTSILLPCALVVFHP